MKDKLIDRIIQKVYELAINAGVAIILLSAMFGTIGITAWIHQS